MIQKLRQYKFWFSTFGAVATSAGLALFLKNDQILLGVIWALLCITVIAFVVYPGRFDVAALEAALEAFHDAMNFPQDVDVRCAIYVPIKGETQLEQITDYKPGNRGGRGHKIHASKGIVGRAFRESEHWVENLREEVYSSSTYFQSEMVRRWGFTKEEARKLTQDRRSYCTLVIKNQNEVKLGILYCDSNKVSAFSEPETFEQAKRFAPFFTELLKLKTGR